MKPLFVCFYYIVVPSLLGKTLTEAREARKRGRRGRALPYATELPMGATYYVLERHPELRETPARIITRAEQEACPGATDARAFVHAIREIAPEPPSSALRHALLGIARRGVPGIFVDSSLDSSIARRRAISAASSQCLIRAGAFLFEPFWKTVEKIMFNAPPLYTQ